MKIDVLNYLCMADKAVALPFNREQNNVGAWDVVNIAPDPNGYGHWDRIKSPTGYPWDRKMFDENWVYDWITEFSGPGAPAPDPHTYKKFVMNHSTDGKHFVDGLKMFPRYIDSAVNNIPPTFTPKAQTTYRVYSNCKWDGVTHDLGDVMQTLEGPFMIDHGGTIGVQLTLIHKYFYNGTNGVYKTVEENLYALNYGWLRWSCQQLSANGCYEICNPQSGNLTVHNNVVAGAPPKLNFPCF